MEILQANTSHVDAVARLFDLYRQFYQCDPNLDLATRFIRERIEREESIIFLARDNTAGCGFVQIYPSFCSVDAVRIYILYDLYVDHSYRRSGVGRRLMNHATEWAKQQGGARLDLLTAKDNVSAQALYEQLGYKRVLEDFYAYSLGIDGTR